MIVIWTIIIIVILLLAGGAVFLSLQVKRLKRLKMILQEALWRRLNLIPLLIETAGVFDAQTKDKIVVLRKQLMDEPFNELSIKELKGLLNIKTVSDKKIVTLTLEKELREIQRNIDVSLNDYNLAVQKFKILGFSFQKASPGGAC